MDIVEQGSADHNLLETAQLGSDLDDLTSQDAGEKSNTPGGARTPNLRFRRPIPQDSKPLVNKHLQKPQNPSYRPAYRKHEETTEDKPIPVPADLG